METAFLIVAACCCLLLTVSTGLTKPMSFIPCPPSECGPPIPGAPCDLTDETTCKTCVLVGFTNKRCQVTYKDYQDGATCVDTDTGGFCSVPASVVCFLGASCNSSNWSCTDNDDCVAGHPEATAESVPGFIPTMTACP